MVLITILMMLPISIWLFIIISYSCEEGNSVLKKTLQIIGASLIMTSPIWSPLCAGLLLLLKSSNAISIGDFIAMLAMLSPIIGVMPIVLNSKISIIVKLILIILYWCGMAVPWLFGGGYAVFGILKTH